MNSNCQLLIFTCVLWVAQASSLSCFGEYCFQVPDGAGFKTLSNASAACKNSGLTLLEISSSQIQNSVSQFISQLSNQSLNGTDLILNAARVTKSSDFYWINGKIQSGALVGGGSTSNAADYQDYGYLRRTDSAGAIYRDSPTSGKGYICEYNASSQSCSFTFNGRCYRSNDSSVGWFDARNRCLQGGGDLAVFDYITSDPGLNDLVRSWTQLTGYYWIGIRRVWWKWNELDTDATYTNFVSGRPNVYKNECLCLASVGQRTKWVDCCCQAAYPFICYTVIPTTTSATTTSATTTSATTPSKPSTSATATSSSSRTATTTEPFLRSTVNSEPGTSDKLGQSSLSTPTSGSATPLSGSSGFDRPSETPIWSTTQHNDTVEIGIGIGIGIGCIVLILICIIIIVIVVVRRRRKSNEKAEGKPEDNHYDYPDFKNTATYESLDYTKLNLNTDVVGSNQVNSDVYDKIIEVTGKAEPDGKVEGHYNELIATEEEPRYTMS